MKHVTHALRFLAFAAAGLATACSGAGSPNQTPATAGAPSLSAIVAATATQSPPPGLTALPSSWSRIAPFQVFDEFPSTGTAMTSAEISADAHRYPAVWSSFNPAPWFAAKPSIKLSRYYVPPEDSNLISGHNLAWFQTNHPDWILYTCDPNNNPTSEIAYVPGIGFPDVPLDIHNPAVVDYQIRQSLAPYMISNHYNVAAFDQILFTNFLVGGNPELGQQIMPGYYACGIYTAGPQNPNTFVRRYASKSDPQYGADILNWLQTAKNIFTTDPTIAPYKFKIFINHTVQSQSDPNEIALLSLVDMELDEVGFSDYGNYQKAPYSGLFGATVSWMKWLQSHNVAIGIIDKFAGETKVTGLQEEYSIATYLMGKEQGAYLFTVPDNGPGYGYGAEQWHYEYETALGAPCQEMYGGSAYDPKNPQIWYRQFANGLSVVNSGSLPLPSENATLPAGRVYKDIHGRKVTNPLSVASNDGYVLTTAKGTGCN